MLYLPAKQQLNFWVWSAVVLIGYLCKKNPEKAKAFSGPEL